MTLKGEGITMHLGSAYRTEPHPLFKISRISGAIQTVNCTNMHARSATRNASLQRGKMARLYVLLSKR